MFLMVFAALVIVYFTGKLAFHFYTAGYEGKGVISSGFYKAVNYSLHNAGYAGGIVTAGLILYGMDMLTRAVNPAAYSNFPLLSWLHTLAGYLFLLSLVLAVFHSLRSMCIIGIELVVGIVVLEYFNITVLNTVDAAGQVSLWIGIAMCVLFYLLGPVTLSLLGIIYLFLGTIGFFGPVLLVLFCVIAVVIMPYIPSSANMTVYSVGLIDWRILGVILLCLAVSMVIEKPSRKNQRIR